jgi:hypothetical protein
VITAERNGKPAHTFLVYRLEGLKKEIPIIN